MKKHLLWIEDDYFAIKGLFRPLEREGFAIDVAVSALEGYQKAKDWKKYDLLVVDLIMPLSDSDETWSLPQDVESWKTEEYAGIGLLKWLKRDLNVQRPIMVLSVFKDPVTKYGLEDLNLEGALFKRGLLPSQVKEAVFEILDLDD
jgi:CheY-like chemotaxis protein